MSTSYIKRRIGRFHAVVVQWTSNKCTKKRHAELLFFSYTQLFVCLFVCFFCVVVVVVVVVVVLVD